MLYRDKGWGVMIFYLQHVCKLLSSLLSPCTLHLRAFSSTVLLFSQLTCWRVRQPAPGLGMAPSGCAPGSLTAGLRQLLLPQGF